MLLDLNLSSDDFDMKKIRTPSKREFVQEFTQYIDQIDCDI